MTDDHWKNRSTRMRCATCMWYVAKNPPSGVPDEFLYPLSLGRCRRHAPTMSGYPVVYEADWCGDHKLDETARMQMKAKCEKELRETLGGMMKGDSSCKP